MTAYLLLPLIQSFLCLVLAVVVILGSQRGRVHRQFFFFLTGLAVWGVVIFGMRSRPDPDSAYEWERWTIVLQPLIAAMFLHFAILESGARIRRWVVAAYYGFCVASAVLSRTPLVIPGMLSKPHGYTFMWGPLAVPWMLTSFSAYIVSLAVFIRSFRRSGDPDRRMSEGIIIAGIILFLVGGLFDMLPALGLPLYPGYIVGTILFCILTTFAIMRYNLLDIQVLLRGATSYVLLVGVVSLPMVGISFLASHFSQQGQVPAWGYVAVFGVLVAAIPPLWRLVRQRVDRWFLQERYGYVSALEEFARETQSLADAELVGQKMVSLLSGALRRKKVALLQRTSPTEDYGPLASTGGGTHGAGISFRRNAVLVRWLRNQGEILSVTNMDSVPQLQAVSEAERKTLSAWQADLVVPIRTHRGELSGILLVGPADSLHQTSDREKQVVLTLTRQMGAKLENVLLFNSAQLARRNLEAWLNTMPDCVLTLDRDCTIEFMNRAAVERFGNSVGERCWDAFGRGEACSFCPLHRGDSPLLSPNQAFRFTEVLKERHYDVAAASLVDPDGTLSMVLVMREITEQVKADARLRDMERRMHVTSRLAAVGEMAAGIAHEINNPLTTILGYSELLMGEEMVGEAEHDTRMIAESARRVSDIVGRLLAFSRQRKPERRLVDLNDVVRTVADLRAYSFQTSNTDIELDLDESLPRTVVDPGQIQQVFLNIVINAEREMRLANGRGRLRVRTWEEGEWASIGFTNDGPTIPENIRDRLFEPFFTTRKDEQGTGLGLSICHGIVTEHGGRISATNEPEGGVTFLVELPVVVTGAGVETGAEQPSDRSLGQFRVLVVDDEPGIRGFLTDFLHPKGHQIDVARTGDEALERLGTRNYDVVLLDVRMPGMSGIELYRQMRKRVTPAADRVILMTGDLMDPETRDFLSTTNIPHLEKPFTTAELEDALAEILH